MRRRGLLGGAVLAGLGAVPARAQRRDLTVASRGGVYQEAQRDVLFRPWTQSRRERLLEETWDGGIDILRRRIASGANTWDVVQVDAEDLLAGCREGLFEPMDWEAIGGRDHYLPQAVGECGVGAILYAFIFAWDRDRLRLTPRSWADVFDTTRIPGRRALRRGPKVTLESALLADGVAAAGVYALLATPAGQDRAFRVLDRLRGDIAWWDRPSEPAQWLASGEVAVAVADNGRIAAANAEDGRNFGIGWQGNIATADSWVIMRGTPNRELALDFLRFAGRPEVQASLPPRIPYGVTARATAGLLPREVMLQLPTAPQHAEAGLMLDDRFWLAQGGPLTRRFEAWLAG